MKQWLNLEDKVPLLVYVVLFLKMIPFNMSLLRDKQLIISGELLEPLWALIISISQLMACYNTGGIKKPKIRFGEQKKFSLYRLENQTVWNIKTALNVAIPSIYFGGNWISTCETAERIKPMLKCTHICWKKPNTGKLKINTDGSFCKVSKKDGIGGIIRDEEGKLVMAFSIPIECGSSNFAEAMAVEFGSSWCGINGIDDIQVELDSQAIANMLTK
ncbi:uncharacterized protein LOC132631752 [Lycium barbarum]|uniref:uncharacterized protein LOC132631752 n=1 Tax=Lycium barbarum TaxID=112863 RepID=UPI00293EDAC9|nr:uncharacterized protein LOC132631752 [Lycium barbarum]